MFSREGIRSNVANNTLFISADVYDAIKYRLPIAQDNVVNFRGDMNIIKSDYLPSGTIYGPKEIIDYIEKENNHE